MTADFFVSSFVAYNVVQVVRLWYNICGVDFYETQL